MKMIEKIARQFALHQGARFVGPGKSDASREFGWGGDGEHFVKYVEAHWKEYENAARMALEAMREPTDEMKAAVYWVENSDLPSGWRNMIDAALSDASTNAVT